MTSNEPPSPVRNRSRSPPPAASLNEAVAAAAEIARRTCPVCLRLFDNPKAMWGHSWVHHERKEHIHSTAPPAPPALPAAGPMHYSVAEGSAWHPWKIDSKEDRDRTCPKCAKMFNSPKAMFGHLHVHHERPRSRKAKGEGTSKRPVAKPVLVQIERPVVVIPNREEPVKEKDVEESDSPVSIDLNRPVFMEEEMDGDEKSSPSSIDLNKMPPGC